MISLDKLCGKLPDIALIAPMRAGKDEFFLILEELGFPVKRIAFGDDMKEMAHLEYPEVPREPKPIEFYQKYGKEKRSKDEDIFVRSTMSKLWFHKQLDKNHEVDNTYIFTDVRQPNEYNAIRDVGFVTVKIEASEEARIRRMIANGETVSQDILQAPTERFLEGFPAQYTISNNGTREQFRQEIIELIYKLQTREGN